MQASKDSNTPNAISEMFNSNLQTSVLPYFLLSHRPFDRFETDKLENDTIFDTLLQNRSMCYYGSVPYTYSTISHQPKPIPTSGNYIAEILSRLHELLPNFQYNSVLITRQNNGDDCLSV